MNSNALNELLTRTIDELTDDSSLTTLLHECHDGVPLPSGKALQEIIELCRAILFPGFYGQPTVGKRSVAHYIGVNLERLYALLSEQVQAGLCFAHTTAPLPVVSILGSSCEKGTVPPATDEAQCASPVETAHEIAAEFISHLPKLRAVLATDVEAAYNGDPAAESFGEIISCYPIIKAVSNYRIAHELLLLGVPLIPRIITEMAHGETGIDIHPAATIGHHFTIDHGTGVVIGATCIIGNHVKLYQGVTLGAKSFPLDENGHPIKGIPRHPILEDNVIVYSNATVLGRITIGRGAVIGANKWVMEDIPSPQPSP